MVGGSLALTGPFRIFDLFREDRGEVGGWEKDIKRVGDKGFGQCRR